MFNFTPLLGAQSTSNASQSLLEFEGGIKILIDVGWDNDFQVEQLRALEKHISTLSIILLTHATPGHIAAFAHCCKHFPLFTQIPIYATTPVISLGRTLLQDIYASTPLAATLIPKISSTNGETTEADSDILLQPPTAEEIASYFNLINPLRYSQPHQPLQSPFSPPLNGLTITAYNAGHSLGGTIWHIQHGLESVVYAVDWNLTRENVISSASWLDGAGSEVIEQLRKPTALICSSRGIEQNPQAISRPKRDELLLDMIRSALNKGGSVLIPSDSSARVLELAWILEAAWKRNDDSLQKAQLVFASRTAGSTMDFTRSMIEWMDENITKAFEADTEKTKTKNADGKRANGKADGEAPDASTTGPFSFKHLRLVETAGKIRRLLEKRQPMVIVASDTTLGWGFSRQVLKHIAADPNSLVILTESLSSQRKPSLGASLWQAYESKQGVRKEQGKSQTFDLVPATGQDLRVEDLSRVDLDAKELATYQQYLATQRQLQQVQNEGTAQLEDSNDVVDDASVSSSSSEESDDERQGKSLNFSSRTLQQTRNKATEDKEVQGINALLRKPGCYDWDVRGKKGREAVFPIHSKRRRADEYGELIRPEDYLRAEERDEIEGRDLREGNENKNSGMGEKRKWGDISKSGDGTNGLNGKRSKQRKTANGTASPESDSESDEETTITGPSRLVTTTTTIQANLGITYLEFSGLHDGRSLTMLIPLIRPRKVILIAGTESEVEKLAGECRQRFKPITGGGHDVLTPVDGEQVAASMDTNAWTLKLSRDLVKKIQWQEVKGLEVVTLAGRLRATTIEDSQDSQRRKRIKTAGKSESPAPVVKSTKDDLPPTLDILPANLAAATRSGTQPVHVGDLRLADLRKMLQSTGHTADFRGEGTLVVDNLVAVKKSINGQIELETTGSNTPLYQTRNPESPFNVVKKRIYEGLAIIAGG